MEKRVILISLLTFIILIAGVSAEILIGQTDSLYSIGDSLDFNITLSSSTGISDFLIAKLVCSGGEIEIYRSPHSLAAGDRKFIPIGVKLDSLLLKNLGGICKIEAAYGQSKAYSQNFNIDNRVNVVFYAGSIANPGEEIRVSGSAKKSNGEAIDGFLEINIYDLGLSNRDLVKEGEFNSSLFIPGNSRSGSYEISIRVYDKDNLNVVANEGNNSGMIRIRQIIEEIDLAFESLETLPGRDFVYSALLYDQAGDQSKQEVHVSLINPKNKVVQEEYVVAGSVNNFSLDAAAMPGNWKISAEFNDLFYEKEFLVNELEDASFYITNNTLYVRNTGNVPFDDAIKISIGQETVTKEVSLSVGSIKKFKLSAPEGDYPIGIVDEDKTFYLGTAVLSGKAVGVGDYEEVSMHITFWIWLVILIILALVTVYSYKKRTNKRFYGKEPPISHFTPKDSGEDAEAYLSKIATPKKSYSFEEKSMKIKENNKLETYGNKDKAVIVALNVRNLEDIASSGEDSLAPIEKIIESARKRGAKFKNEENYKLFIFSPGITKDPGITYSALEFINKVDTFLTEHNKKRALKINFGIGANVGELIIESQQGKFKISSSGNTILLAKKAAARAKNEAIISQALKREMPTLLKTTPLQGENFFKLNSLVNRSPQEEFLNKFMNRNKK